jgi:SAM-dependent methyltransferase
MLDHNDPFTAIAAQLADYRRADICRDIAPCEDMLDAGGDAALEHYLSVGRSAIYVIARAMVLSGMTTASRSVLDLPCGGGRVTRHLAAFLPKANLFVGDVNPAKVTAVCRQFDAQPINAGDFSGSPARQFDLIWVGSLLTHLDEAAFRRALAWFSAALEPGGTAVITLLGRRHLRNSQLPNLAPERWATMMAGYELTGFGYAPDYPGAEVGMTLSSMSFVTRLFEDRDVRIIGYHEAGWVNDQDVIVLQRV